MPQTQPTSTEMRIYRPIRSNNKTQAFGENLACAKVNTLGGLIEPTKVVTATKGVCPVGYKPFYPLIGMSGHNGEDWGAYSGEPVFFPVEIEDVEWEAATEIDEGGGIGVRVRSKQPVPLSKLPPQARELSKRQFYEMGAVHLLFLFWHLKSVDVYDKKPIKFGDRIGFADSTGASSGDHLHWALKPCDKTSWFTLDKDNGYTGAWDWHTLGPIFDNKFVLDVITERQTQGLSAADKVAVIAAQKQAAGDNKMAAILWAIVQVIKAFLVGGDNAGKPR